MTLRDVVIFCGCIVAAIVSASCDRDLGFGPDDYDSIETIIYSQHVQPLLNRRCATSGCHNAETAAEELVMTSWQSLMQGSHNGAVVIPFRPEKSHLIFHVNRDSNIAPVANPQMPPDEPLSTVEVEFLMRWIREGAKNDFGRVPFDEPGRGRVVVTNQSDDEVAIIDATSNLLMRMVPVGTAPQPESPHNVTVDRQGNFYYVNLIAGNEIWKFDARTNEKLGTLSLGAQRSPAQVAVNPDGTIGYVTNYDVTKTNRSIQKFSTLSMQLEADIFDQRMIARTASRGGQRLTRKAVSNIGSRASNPIISLSSLTTMWLLSKPIRLCRIYPPLTIRQISAPTKSCLRRMARSRTSHAGFRTRYAYSMLRRVN